MSIANATPDQLQRVYNFIHMLRATTIHQWSLNNNTNALIEDWNADILAIIGTPTGIVINDGSGLAGSVPLTDTQVTNLFGIMQTWQTNTMTASNQTIFMMATGPNNSTGT